MLRNKSRKRVVRGAAAHTPTHRDTDAPTAFLPCRRTQARSVPSSSAAMTCAGGCGFQITWHATHCCKRCKQTPGKHGPMCSKRRAVSTNEVKQEGPSETAAAPIDSKGLSSQSHLLPFSVLARAFGHGDGSYRFLAACGATNPVS